MARQKKQIEVIFLRGRSSLKKLFRFDDQRATYNLEEIAEHNQDASWLARLEKLKIGEVFELNDGDADADTVITRVR
jgi:hypothetical protein